MKSYQITEWCAHFIRMHVSSGAFCIDATMGNGHDTLLLSRLAGERGKVLAFDIQERALVRTRLLLEKEHAPKNYRLILDSHTKMAEYTQSASVDCIVFNFGYLPGGDHTLATCAQSSIAAIALGLKLLKKGGLMSLCIYSGGDTGFDERDAILAFIQKLDSRQYLAIRSEYANRPNHPPIPVMIIRL